MAILKEVSQSPHFERRWQVGFAILSVIAVLALLPGRLRLFPFWFPYVVGVVVLLPVTAVGLSAGKTLWLRIERMITLCFFVFTVATTLTILANLIQMMIQGPAEINGLRLLTSSIAVWVTNILMFSLLYWQIDRGGPEARVNKAGVRPDWIFPPEGVPSGYVRPDWRPVFVDYLFLSYSTATAFSTTDVPPLTCRAKMWMMLESTISLVTLLIVASRAINILSS